MRDDAGHGAADLLPDGVKIGMAPDQGSSMPWSSRSLPTTARSRLRSIRTLFMETASGARIDGPSCLIAGSARRIHCHIRAQAFRLEGRRQHHLHHR